RLVKCANRIRKVDQVVTLQQPPAEVVRQQLSRGDFELCISRLHAPLGRLRIQSDDPLTLLRKDPDGAVGSAECGPGKTLRSQDTAKVGQLLGRRVEAAGRNLNRDFLRHEAHNTTLWKPGNRCIVRVLVDRATRKRTIEGRIKQERKESKS